MTITVIERENGGIMIKGDPEDHLDAQMGNAIMEEAIAITHDHLPYQSMSLGFDVAEIIPSIKLSVQAVSEAVKKIAQKDHKVLGYAKGGVIMEPHVPHMQHVHYSYRPPYDKGMINDDVKALVILLGTMEAGEIASWLHARGHHGVPSDGWDCPVAKALFAETGQHIVVSRSILSGGNDHLETPPSIREFVELFDRGRYPDLITGNQRDHRGVSV